MSFSSSSFENAIASASVEELRASLAGLPKDQLAKLAEASPMSPRLSRYEMSVDFPPKESRGPIECSLWFRTTFESVPMKAHDPSTTQRESELLRLSAQEYVEERKSGRVTCEEFTSLLVRRARYYRYMNQWTFRSYELMDAAVTAAKALDEIVKKEGIEAIAPLYGLPIPMKGTAAVVEYPSGGGCGILSGYTPVKSSALTELIQARHGIIFGTTNVPEFAASVNTANPASGQTRNPYNHAFAPGGSSGGAASAVSMHMCPVAVSEDTGGSTRIPAMFCGLFGFDPARNHYPNEGNCAMSITRDQLGVVARSMHDIIFYDRTIMQDRHGAEELHNTAVIEAASRAVSAIKIGTPLTPWVSGGEFQTDEQMMKKYKMAKAALIQSGFTVVEESWPCLPEDTGDVSSTEWVDSQNVKPIDDYDRCRDDWGYRAYAGQVAQWAHDYLQAPVSLKEISEDIGQMGVHNPAGIIQNPDNFEDETEYRFAVGPFIKDLVERWNSLFDAHGLDFILVPAAHNPTPDLADALAGTIPAIGGDGSAAKANIWQSVYPINHKFKDIHIPKLAVPTGLSDDGRPTGVQIWGRAVPYEEMFDDKHSTKHSIRFLHLAVRLVEAIHSDKNLCRVPPPMVQKLFTVEDVS